jgi:RNA polymerase sigma factor (sigma-70 family)
MSLFLTEDQGGEAAFRVLIHRHGPMVLGICRRVLGDEHAAEDAFQTTFLVLVKKAGRLRDRTLLGNWLYGVALRIASKEKARGSRRRLIEQRVTERSVELDGPIDQAELRSVIDEEIRRLPERYRAPLVLCHLEGLRHEEAARRLGCPVGTIESRLSRARAQLKARLERRGLAPTASVMGLVLRPPSARIIAPPLVESTLRIAIGQISQRNALGTAIASLVYRVAEILTVRHVSAGISMVVVCASVAAVGFGVYRARAEPRKQPAPPPALRNPSAVAYPLRGLTIDGRLDDWPKGLTRYPIQNQSLNFAAYSSGERDKIAEPDAYFMVAYDPDAELIYLAVVVPDKAVIARAGGHTGTDALEVYVDGAYSTRTLNDPSEDWTRTLDARTMPALQYAAVPGQVAAYGDRWDDNPSLVYATTRQRITKMKYQRENDVITYEWAFKAYDQYPDLPTHLYSGKRLGFDLAILDKDDVKLPPYFLTWGAPPARFKGFDAGSLGELILVGDR